ncbi:MAG: PAS domain S-box protein [Ignavibacteriales bacterium]|nr:PAS domain S-box protein [Ignavibacteriales bacterium]
MEFILSFLIFGSLLVFSVYTLRRKYLHQLLSEQDKVSSLSLVESQLKQKNQIVSDELDEAKKKIESLSQELSQHISAEQDARAILDSLSKQLSNETMQRATKEEQLTKAQQMVSSASSQLKSTVEERMRELQFLQEQLHNESAARKQLEGIVSLKEAEQKETDIQLRRTEEQLQRAKESLTATSAELHATIERHEETIRQLQNDVESLKEQERQAQKNIADLNAAKSALEQEIASLTAQLRDEHSSRTSVESDKTTLEQTLKTKITDLESQLSTTTELLQKTSDSLNEETTIRVTIEHALQESKERLYAVIHTLESNVAERDHTIASLGEKLLNAESTAEKLSRAVRNIVSQTPIPIFIVDEQGFCTHVNDSLHATVGYSADDIVGRHFSKLFPEQERIFYEEQWKSTSDRTEQFKGETHVATPAGDTLTAEINFIEIETEAGKLFVGCIVDKTDEQEAERHFGEARVHAEELKQLKSRFISMVTNQLRASLVTVATNAELLERFILKWSDEKRYRAFFRINESLKQMMDLLRDVETSTASTTNYAPAVKMINLESLAQSVVKDVVSDLDTKQRFILSEQGNISSVPVDERIVRMILQQTISNAFKFSSETQEVKLHIERRDSECILIVQDQGIGIPALEKQHLFTSFFRASNVGNMYGTGLGLTIVQQYVRLAGGTISFDSELNKGTTVTITLPIPQT